jgi:Fe2+ or Zn2+ uptake regulation protein
MDITMSAESIHDQAAAMLRQDDNRYTPGRRRLVEVLEVATGPLTLPQILAEDPELTQSSAYRNLDVLAQSGVILRIIAPGDHAAFELAEPLLGHHHHLICLSCGLIQDIHIGEPTEVAIDAALGAAAREVGFRPMHHSLDLHGHCASCQESLSRFLSQ